MLSGARKLENMALLGFQVEDLLRRGPPENLIEVNQVTNRLKKLGATSLGR